MKKSKSAFPALFFFGILIVIAFFGYCQIKARIEYGLPASGLGWLRQLRYAVQLSFAHDELNTPRTGQDVTSFWTVELEQSVTSVCSMLQGSGHIPSGPALCAYLIYTGKDRTIVAGDYLLPATATPRELGDFIANPANRVLRVNLYPGMRLEEIADLLGEFFFSFSHEDFLAYVQKPPQALSTQLGLPEGQGLEGFFVPKTYRLPPQISLEDCVKQMLIISDPGFALTTEGDAAGLSLYQILTVASIIQRETTNAEEMPTIASVLYNRLSQNWLLQMDPTVQYALGYNKALQSWWPAPLSYDDLAVDSSYNTYLYKGLPPGPICSPGRQALEGAMHPQTTPYMFYRAKCDGSIAHNFSETYEEHLAKGCE